MVIRSSDPLTYPSFGLFLVRDFLPDLILIPIRFPPYSYTLLDRTSLFLLCTLYTAYILLRFPIRYTYYFRIVISLKLDAPFNGLTSYRVDSRPITPTVIRIKIIPSIVSLLFIRFILYYLLFLFLINIIHTTIHAIYTIFI